MEPTSSLRPVWWMWVVAASYVVTFGFILFQAIRGPAQLTLSMTLTDGAMTVGSVVAGSPESRGGVRVGDRLVAIDDRPILSVHDWVAATGNATVGRPQRWSVDRDSGEVPVALEIRPERATVRDRLVEGYLQYFGLLLTGLPLGLLIAWKRPGDAIGRLGAWFMLTASIAFGFPWGWAVAWRALPPPIQMMLWIPQLSRFVLEGIFLSFFLVFPRRLLKRRWPWLLVWTPVLATLPFRVIAFDGVIHPRRVPPVPAWILGVGVVRTIVYLLVAIGLLGVSYRRLLDLDAKRRVRVLMAGTAASALSAVLMVWVDGFLGRLHLNDSKIGFVFVTIVVPFNAACPLSLAYAILRHRVLDISFIVRQGLQYVLARGAVIGLVPALGAILVIDLASNRRETLEEILRGRGWLYAAGAGLSLLAYWKRREWLAAIDRRFFRERVDTERVLRDVLDDVRSSRDFERVAPRVVERLETAFHAEFVSAMVLAPEGRVYRSLVTIPVERTPRPLAAETKLVGLLRLLGKPLEVLHSDSNWLDHRLPVEEARLLRQARIDLLVPVSKAQGHLDALLALGMKRSEEPYTREDQELVEAIAASLALLVEAPAKTEDKRAGSFQECPDCGTCYAPASTTCDRDGAALVETRFSRLLGSRYRLDRRRGHGGMGTVYEASDSALDRRVAIKLIRDDRAASAEAIERFRREARAAAGFAHPNVVTIHDYGVESDGRAFLVMELLEGFTLREELRRSGRLSPSRLAEVFRGVCAGVEAAHRQQLIHRDLKPANIFIALRADEMGEVVKVLDFGIAKFLPVADDSTPTRTRAETHTGVLVGTPAYMSPEQLLGEKLDSLWDVWALSVVAYEALTGALPFLGTSDWQSAVISGRFTPLSVHLPEAPARWKSFFDRCFSIDRRRRPASAEELLEQLERAVT
jgi:tRNA A-37 threonylcarbamoyl transferase component Bud32